MEKVIGRPKRGILDDGEKAPFSKVRSADVGLRFDMGDPLHVTAGGFYANLSDDVAFHAEEGRLERDWCHATLRSRFSRSDASL